MSDLSYIGPPASPVAAPFDLGYRPPPAQASARPVQPAPASLRDQVVGFWQSSGAPPHVAQGIADAVHGESGFNASDNTGDGGTSWGMYQHHADRLDRLKAFAAQRGKSWSDPAVQNQFALSEVRGGDAIAAAHWKEILNAPDRETAKALWSRYFERPAGSQSAGGGVNQDELAARKAAGTEMMGAVEQFKKATADATAGSPEWNAAYHAAMDKFNSASEKLETAIADKPSPPQSEMFGHFGSMATVIGMIAGMFARRPLMGMLNGAAGAMSAQNQGDWDRYHASMDQWKANSEMLLHVSEMQQRYLQNIMEDRSKEMSEKLALANSFLEANKMTYQMKLAEAGMPDQLLKSSLDIQAGILNLQKLKGEIENGGLTGPVGADMKLRLQEYAEAHKDAPNPPPDIRRKMLEESTKSTGGAGRAWQVVVDTDGTQYRYDPQTHEATTLTGEPYTPKGGAVRASSTTASSVRYSDGDVAFWGSVMAHGGSMPAGMTRTSQGSELVQRAAKWAAEHTGGDPGAYIANVGQTKANQSSLTNMTRMADAATSFERTARQNFDYALSIAPEAIPTDWGPWLNRWVETGETQTGNAAVPAYVTAMLTAANEYAKIMSGSTGAQGSTVDSRREAAELFSPYLAKGQIRRVVEVAEGDMDRRKQSLYGQVQDIRQRLHDSGEKGAGAPSQDASPPSGGVVIQNGWRYDAKTHQPIGPAQ